MKSNGKGPIPRSHTEQKPRLSRTHAPTDLSPEEWQRGLRRQFGREQAFGLENLTGESFFSEFRISNPASKSSYRVAIRGMGPGSNFCSCPDYATNELGTCKHIKFTLARLEQKRGAKAAFARGYQPAFSELYLRNDGRRRIYFRAAPDCRPALREAAAALFDAGQDGMLPDERYGELESFMAVASKSGHEFRAYDDALDFIAGRRDAERRALKLAELFPQGGAAPELAALLKVPLDRYQAEGALFTVRADRALIGDDMGLGKTVQAIAAMEILARHFDVTRVLVICPTSLKYQWQSEVLRFSRRQTGTTVQVINGGRAQRQTDYRLDDFCKITNYEKLKPDLDLIADWSPDLVIVDEAQRVKNWNTIAARTLKRIDSPYPIVLAGTALENKLEELISIVQFVDQHRLGPTWKLLHDHGVKADELAALFDDLFAEPKAKAVVFSQWTRTHEIIIRRIEARGLGYVSFHGGVPSDKRPALVERFRDDPACRVFLSTDAGSTGVNLQHASMLVNMDLPWNPAVLGHRIARIHRIGQAQPVRVINFVANGTIEEGMLRYWRSSAHCRLEFSTAAVARFRWAARV